MTVKRRLIAGYKVWLEPTPAMVLSLVSFCLVVCCEHVGPVAQLVRAADS
jgi:hypothetical protein